MRVSVAEIAAEAGVSVATVSRVLSDRGSVAAATRARVRSVASRLGYARSTLLPATTTPMVGVCRPASPEEWQIALCRQLGRDLQAAGILVATPELFDDGQAVRHTVQAGAAALVAPVFTPPAVANRLPAGSENVPVVRLAEADALDSTPQSANDHIAARVDLAQGLRLAFDHLVSLGHRRIGLVVNDTGNLGASLRRVFLAEHPARAIRSDLSMWVAEVPKSAAGGAAAARRLMDATCTAVIVQSALQIHGISETLRSRRLMIPRDLSLVSFGDSPTLSFTQPPVTALSMRVPALAGALLSGLREVLGRSADDYPSAFAVPPVEVPTLVSRRSTAEVRE